MNKWVLIGEMFDEWFRVVGFGDRGMEVIGEPMEGMCPLRSRGRFNGEIVGWRYAAPAHELIMQNISAKEKGAMIAELLKAELRLRTPMEVKCPNKTTVRA